MRIFCVRDMAAGVTGRCTCECRRDKSFGRRGTPGDVGESTGIRCLGKDAVLENPSKFRVTASDCRCDTRRGPSTRGVPADVRDAVAVPFVSTRNGFFVLRTEGSVEPLEPGRVFLAVLVLVLPETVALRPSLGAAAGASNPVSSIGLGLRAWAMASGPASCGRKGTPTLANTRLASIVTGKTFSCMRSLLGGSPPPKTILWTLL